MDSAGMYMDRENYVQNVDALTCSDVKAWTYLIQFLCSPYSSTFRGPNPATYIKTISHIIHPQNVSQDKKAHCTYQNSIQDRNMLSFPNKSIGLSHFQLSTFTFGLINNS